MAVIGHRGRAWERKRDLRVVSPRAARPPATRNQITREKILGKGETSQRIGSLSGSALRPRARDCILCFCVCEPPEVC
ncbi:hypothetical protein EVAR_27894_1 [Eumeta japonica]|uniref:Uncharacterized protein n=1 Tax=Eumeta variegata TaxID=151549 RepID=A0A4C1UWB2_EUMVA|nr:hypothetical protein EVAR_27894_1 [Eumeta japonica]